MTSVRECVQYAKQAEVALGFMLRRLENKWVLEHGDCGEALYQVKVCNHRWISVAVSLLMWMREE